MTTTVSTYPWHQFLSSTGTWHKGNGLSFGVEKVFTFPDALTNVSSVDFTGMRRSNGSLVTFRNTTRKVNGGFSIYVYDDGDNVIGQSVLSINASQTKFSSNFSEITLPSGSNVKKIAFFAFKQGAHISVEHDSTSEFEITHERSTEITGVTPYSTAVGFNSSKTGSSYRIVQRIENAYRKIADDADIVLLENVQSDNIIKGLEPGESHTLVIQEHGNAWYDLDEIEVTTETVTITTTSIGSESFIASWTEDFPGAVYTLSATSSDGSSSLSVETTGLSAIILDLLAGTKYTVSVSSK